MRLYQIRLTATLPLFLHFLEAVEAQSLMLSAERKSINIKAKCKISFLGTGLKKQTVFCKHLGEGSPVT